MTTKEFNKMRTEQWAEVFTQDKSRIFMMVGCKQDGTLTFLADESQTLEKIAQKLEEMAKEIRMQISKTN